MSGVLISDHPRQKYDYDGQIYPIKRKFIEQRFIFDKIRKFVSLLGEVEHFVELNSEVKSISTLNIIVDITASNKRLVYADNGDYVVYQKDENGNVVYDETDLTNPIPIIINSERGVVGEYTFFETLRNVPIAINSLVQNVILRHDALKRFD